MSAPYADGHGPEVIMGRAQDVAPNYAAIFDYGAQPKEWVPGYDSEECRCCNLCEVPNWTTNRHDRDRYGYAVMVERCECGLVYLNPRMTPAAYADFYASGAYRRLVSAYHGREINAETIQAEQRVYGERLADLLEPYVPAEATDVLDVGGSTGVVALRLSKRFDLAPTVLDPATEEVAHARQPGVRVIPWAVEDWVPCPGDRFEVVTLCQTIDHLLDPLGSVRKIHGLLAPGGIFWLDALDYDRTRQIKIDHPYNFTERTLRALVEKAGFAIVDSARDVSADGNHVGFVCRKVAA